MAPRRNSIPTFRRFLDIQDSGQATGGGPSQPWRAMDQLSVLNRYEPKIIWELGSGTSTGIFSEYVRDIGGANLISYDESDHWARLTQKGLETAGLDHDQVSVRHVPRLENDQGSYYDALWEGPVDLVYVDGPSVKRVERVKLPNQDILRMLKAGIRPRVIMIDGRYATTDAIRSSDFGEEYDFQPCAAYRFNSGLLRIREIHRLPDLHRHSLFVRKT